MGWVGAHCRRVFIQGHSGAAADLPTYVVEEDSFYLSFNNNKQGLPIKELKREGEYRVRLESACFPCRSPSSNRHCRSSILSRTRPGVLFCSLRTCQSLMAFLTI